MEAEPFCSFRSNATRLDWWMGQVFFAGIVIAGVLMVMDLIRHGLWPAYFLAIPVLWMMLALTMNRLRDAGLSPWFSLAMFIPIVNAGLWLICGFKSSGTRKT